MKLILKLFGFIGIFIFAGLGYLAYSLGIIGTPKPKDLGVTYSAADLTAADTKSQVVTTISAGATTISYEGSHSISKNFTAQELTAVANERTWSNLPFSNVQIRINPDNTIEFSGNVATAKLADYLVAVGGLSRDMAEKIKGYVPVQGNPSFYLHTSGKIINNQTSLAVSSVQIGPVSIPDNYINQYQPMVTKFINDRIAAWSGMQVNSLTFSGGQLVFEGNLPDKEIINK